MQLREGQIQYKPHFSTLITILAVMVWGCGKPASFEDGWGQVRNGMTKEQVLEILGNPQIKHSPTTITVNSKQEDSVQGDEDSEVSLAAAGGLAGAFGGSAFETWEYRPKEAAKSSLTEEEKARALVDSLFGPQDDSYVIVFNANGTVRKLRMPISPKDPPQK